jgi:hypothetical protein
VGEATPELIDHLRGEYEQILIAAAPMLKWSCSFCLSARPSRRDLSRTAAKLRMIGAPPTGSVLVGKYTSFPQLDGL